MIIRLLLGCLLFYALEGCVSGPYDRAHSNVLTIATAAEPTSLNPLLLQAYDARMIGALVYSYLTTYNARGRIVLTAGDLNGNEGGIHVNKADQISILDAQPPEMGRPFYIRTTNPSNTIWAIPFRQRFCKAQIDRRISRILHFRDLELMSTYPIRQTAIPMSMLIQQEACPNVRSAWEVGSMCPV